MGSFADATTYGPVKMMR